MTQEGPALSVIIVNYNSGDRLTRVFSALDRQTWRDFETLLVDNASSDDSASLAAEYPHLVTVKMSPVNTGFAGGVMIGATMAKGEWLVVLNPDAYPESDWLEKLMVAAMEYGPETLLGSVQLTEGEEDRLDGLGDVYHMSGVAWRGGFGKSAALTPVEDREIFAPCFAAAAIHRERFLSLGGLDEDFFCYHEDVDFGFRHRLAGGRAVLVHDAIVWAQLHGAKRMNLCMAPLSGLEGAAGSGLRARSIRWIARYFGEREGVAGLRRFKAAFRPEWRPRNLAVRHWRDAPEALWAARRLVTGAAAVGAASIRSPLAPALPPPPAIDWPAADAHTSCAASAASAAAPPQAKSRAA